MRKLMTIAAAVVALAVAQPAGITAQGHKDHKDKDKDKAKVTQSKSGKSHDKADKARDKRDAVSTVSTRRDRNDDDVRDIFRGTLRSEGKGPKFCRNGNGHPVHGRQWCVNKGFGLGNARWDRARWDDVIFRQEPRSNLELGRDVLIDILGGRVLNRLDERRSTFGVTQPLTGRWVTAEGGRNVLLVNAGRTPIAELVDTNRDRRADLVLLNFR